MICRMNTRMGIWGIAAVLVFVVSAQACGGGGGKKKKFDEPTVEAVVPPYGAPGGGETVTVTGTEFSGSTTVSIGGAECADVEVVDDDELTCTTPAGTTGFVDVVVTTPEGTDTLAGGFSYTSVVSSLFPSRIGPGSPVWLVGDDIGIIADPEVTVGGVPCTALTVLNAETLRCVAGSFSTGATTDVVLANEYGVAEAVNTAVGGILYAIDGRSGIRGNLYEINLGNAAATSLGTAGLAVTGAAFGPDGLLWMSESIRPNNPVPDSLVVGTAQLVSMDLFTRNRTIHGARRDVDGNYHNNIPSLLFVGDQLFGWTEFDDKPVTIEPTGMLTMLGDGVNPVDQSTSWTWGSGMAVDASGTIWFAGWGTDSGNLEAERLYRVNPMTGIVTTGAQFSNTDVNLGPINSLAFVDGTLYGVHHDYSGSIGQTFLMSINTTSGAVSYIGDLPDEIDAIVSTSP